MTRSAPDENADASNLNPEEAVTMARPSDSKPSDAAVLAFLRSHHGAEPADLEVLGGGFWSAAYGYRVDGDELVLRINDEPGGFRSDKFAVRYGSAALPVPGVLTIGEGFGRWFAISRRHRGRFLEEVGPEEADVLGPTCQDRRQLVHSDLLHYNVLVSSSADAVAAVFSWKHATWGDAVYDLAWCTFWGRWHDGIGALDLWERVVPTLSAAERVDIGLRHHVYELQIGANHLGWYASLGDDENLAWAQRQLDELLEQGPLG